MNVISLEVQYLQSPVFSFVDDFKYFFQLAGVEFRVPCLIAYIVINMLIEKDGFEKSLIIDPKEKRVFNNIPNLCFELREIENAKLRTLFCQKVQDLDRALFCEMVNTREGAERKQGLSFCSSKRLHSVVGGAF